MIFTFYLNFCEFDGAWILGAFYRFFHIYSRTHADNHQRTDMFFEVRYFVPIHIQYSYMPVAPNNSNKTRDEMMSCCMGRACVVLATFCCCNCYI